MKFPGSNKQQLQAQIVDFLQNQHILSVLPLLCSTACKFLLLLRHTPSLAFQQFCEILKRQSFQITIHKNDGEFVIVQIGEVLKRMFPRPTRRLEPLKTRLPVLFLYGRFAHHLGSTWTYLECLKEGLNFSGLFTLLPK